VIKIGDTELRDRPVFFAPMEDVSDPPFRYMCKKFGADFMYTEFISAEGLIRDARKSLKKLDIYEY
jgi:tRNA-dihydrouridine synthase B